MEHPLFSAVNRERSVSGTRTQSQLRDKLSRAVSAVFLLSILHCNIEPETVGCGTGKRAKGRPPSAPRYAKRRGRRSATALRWERLVASWIFGKGGVQSFRPIEGRVV